MAVVYGNSNPENLKGGAGEDLIYGGDGDDRIRGNTLRPQT